MSGGRDGDAAGGRGRRWMLQISTAGMEASLGRDFAQEYRDSKLYRRAPHPPRIQNCLRATLHPVQALRTLSATSCRTVVRDVFCFVMRSDLPRD